MRRTGRRARAKGARCRWSRRGSSTTRATRCRGAASRPASSRSAAPPSPRPTTRTTPARAGGQVVGARAFRRDRRGAEDVGRQVRQEGPARTAGRRDAAARRYPVGVSATVPTTYDEWLAAYKATPERDAPFTTLSGEEVRPLYTEADVADSQIGLP